MRISFVSPTPTKQSQKPILVLRDPALREFNENAMPPPHLVSPLPHSLCDTR